MIRFLLASADLRRARAWIATALLAALVTGGCAGDAPKADERPGGHAKAQPRRPDSGIDHGDGVADPADLDPNRPRLEGRSWLIPELGFKLTIPAKWYRRRVNDIEIVSEPPSEAAHPANMAVQRIERQGETLDEVLKASEAEIRSLPDVTLDEVRKATVSGREVAVFKWHGKFPANPDPVRGWTYVYLLGDEHQVVLVSSVLESKVKLLGPAIEASLASLVLAEPVAQ